MSEQSTDNTGDVVRDPLGRYGLPWPAYVMYLLLAGMYVAMAVRFHRPWDVLPAVGWLLLVAIARPFLPWMVVDAEGVASRRRGRLHRVAWHEVTDIPQPTTWTNQLAVRLRDGSVLELRGLPRNRWPGVIQLWRRAVA